MLKRGEATLLSYRLLWEVMRQRKITTYVLINTYGISSRTVNNLKHDKSITMYTLEKLCSILKCTPNDVVEFLPNPDELKE